MKIDKKAVWEAVKEPLRWLVLAVIPFGVAYFTEVNYSWAGAIVVVLRMIDKLLHDQAPKGTAGGLVRF